MIIKNWEGQKGMYIFNLFSLEFDQSNEWLIKKIITNNKNS